jgi:hypothetical protein
VFASAQDAPIKGSFAVKNIHTGKYIRIKDANSANGTPIVAYSPVNWKCVTWEFQSAGTANSYTLKNLFSGKTLQPIGTQAKAGVALEEQPLNTTNANTATNQIYELVPVENTHAWYIRYKGTDLYLTPADPHGETNTSILLQPKQPGDLQQWTLIQQNPTM